MDSTRVGLLAGAVSLLAGAVQFLPNRVVGGWIDGGFPAWMPRFGTVGEMVTVFRYAIDVVGPLATVALAVGLGYYLGRRVDVPADHRRLVGATAVGSVLAVLAGWTALMWFWSTISTPFDPVSLALILGSYLQMVVAVSLPVTVGVLAGAALASFRTGLDRPGDDAAPTSPPSGPLESASEDG